MFVYKHFTEAYYDLIKLCYTEPEYMSSPRGMNIKERLGVYFEIQNPRNRLLFVPQRKFSLPYMIAECLWYLTGDNTTDWISEYSSFWKNISDNGVANSAYGSYIFKELVTTENEDNESQWQYIKRELKNDPDSRRAVLHIRQPHHSWGSQKDVPCTLNLQFFVRDNKLNMFVNMRSTDLIYGLSYDVPAFTMLQELMAHELGLELGWYKHHSASLHIYEKHFQMCEDIIKNDPTLQLSWYYAPEMPKVIGMPPVSYMDKTQWEIREVKTEDELKELAEVRIENVPPYWSDWLRVLFIRQAKKLKFNELEQSLLSQIKFEGFKAILA